MFHGGKETVVQPVTRFPLTFCFPCSLSFSLPPPPPSLVKGRPLFAGTSSLHQVDLIMQTLGRPSYVDVDALRSPYARAMVSRTHTRPGPSLHSLVPKVGRIKATGTLGNAGLVPDAGAA